MGMGMGVGMGIVRMVTAGRIGAEKLQGMYENSMTVKVTAATADGVAAAQRIVNALNLSPLAPTNSLESRSAAFAPALHLHLFSPSLSLFSVLFSAFLSNCDRTWYSLTCKAEGHDVEREFPHTAHTQRGIR